MPASERDRIKARIAELRGELAALEDQLAADAADRDDSAALTSCAAAILDRRVALERHVDADLFADPAFDMMLFLFARGAANGINTNDCCRAARVPRTTALRWINLLQARGIIATAPDAHDGRVKLVDLTAAARQSLSAWLRELLAIPLLR